MNFGNLIPYSAHIAFSHKASGGFPIEIESEINKLITYSLAIFIHNIEIAKLYGIIKPILIGNPPYDSK